MRLPTTGPITGSITGRAAQVARRAATATGIDEVRRLARRVEDLEEAVAENTLLAVPLTARVAEVERLLLPALRSRHPEV